jgi:hypothetical protein
MATINAPTLQDVQYSGECPAAYAHGQVNLSSAQIGDKVRLVKLYAGTKIYDMRAVFDDLGGAGAALNIGFEYANGEAGSTANAFFSNIDVGTAAGSVRGSFAPVTLVYDAYITATVAGAAQTGKLDVIVGYEFKGK